MVKNHQGRRHSSARLTQCSDEIGSSAIPAASHMSAFGGKADMALCENPLSRSLFGAKRTYPFALHMRGKTAVSLSQIQPTPLYGRASFIPRSSADLRFYVSVAIGHPR